MNPIILKPQEGPQERFLATSADICIFGGSAGGGKSFALLLEPLRYMDVEGYKAVVFRRNYTQIMAAGGLWDESSKMYRLLPNAVATMSPKAHWTFGRKAVINFDYLSRDDDVYKWQGSQICALCCEVNTPVLMSDGTYKKVTDIKVGDKVMTLKGVQTITHVGVEEEKDCVKVTDEHGNSQIQSTNHEFLTTSGWLSYDSANKSILNYSNPVSFAGKHSLFADTVYKKNGEICIRSGAGIVADSVPENEFQECCNKARAVVQAIETAQEGLE